MEFSSFPYPNSRTPLYVVSVANRHAVIIACHVVNEPFSCCWAIGCHGGVVTQPSSQCQPYFSIDKHRHLQKTSRVRDKSNIISLTNDPRCISSILIWDLAWWVFIVRIRTGFFFFNVLPIWNTSTQHGNSVLLFPLDLFSDAYTRNSRHTERHKSNTQSVLRRDVKRRHYRRRRDAWHRRWRQHQRA